MIQTAMMISNFKIEQVLTAAVSSWFFRQDEACVSKCTGTAQVGFNACPDADRLGDLLIHEWVPK